jgi:2-oxoglutarate dehydrogenase E1 component
MYIRKPEIVQWIQNKLTLNDNQPLFSRKEKMILSKLNEAVSFENFLHTKYVGQKRFHLKVENPLYLRHSLIESAAEQE